MVRDNIIAVAVQLRCVFSPKNRRKITVKECCFSTVMIKHLGRRQFKNSNLFFRINPPRHPVRSVQIPMMLASQDAAELIAMNIAIHIPLIDPWGNIVRLEITFLVGNKKQRSPV